MRYGVLLLPTDPWQEAVARVRHLEEIGYPTLWTYDHLSWRRYRAKPWFAAIPWLTGVAAATSRIRLGTMVASPNFRHPVTLAKEAMTLDHVSAGRFTLGLGAGGTGFDATVFGDEPLSPGARAARLAEFVEVLDALLRQPSTSHRGPALHRRRGDDAARLRATAAPAAGSRRRRAEDPRAWWPGTPTRGSPSPGRSATSPGFSCPSRSTGSQRSARRSDATRPRSTGSC
jgi:alkanesulfonate monooxygenase SsuD/methylene tetrahydromethanopterin reductase-like flavin-dependent oxidoreductase (luciferase family)